MAEFPQGLTRIFVGSCLCEADTPYLERLKTHLSPFIKRGMVDFWNDQMIHSHGTWPQEIRQAISSARVVIFLLSADFLASVFITEEIYPALLKRARLNDADIIAVVLGPCALEQVIDLTLLRTINAPSKPLSSMTHHEQDERWSMLVQSIGEVFKTSEDWIAVGDSHYNKGQYQEALSAYTWALKRDVANARAYDSQGWAFYRLHQPEAAQEAFQNALSIRPAKYRPTYAEHLEASLKERREQDAHFWISLLAMTCPPERRPTLWLSLLDHLQREDIAALSWEVHAALLFQWGRIVSDIDTPALLPWLEIEWSQVERFLDLSLPEDWQDLALQTLLEHQATELSVEEINIVHQHVSHFEGVLEHLMQHPERWQVAVRFYGQLVKSLYRRRRDVFNQLVPLGEGSPEKIAALLLEARLTQDEEAGFIEQHTQILSSLPFLPEAVTSLIERYLGRITQKDLPHLHSIRYASLSTILEISDRAPQNRVATAIAKLAAKAFSEVGTAAGAGDEETLFSWLYLLEVVSPPATHPNEWRSLFSLLAPKPPIVFTRRFWLLQRWSGIRGSIDADLLRPWLEIPWQAVDDFFDYFVPDAWCDVALFRLLERQNQALSVQQIKTVERHSTRFEIVLAAHLQHAEQRDVVIRFYKKLVDARYVLKLSMLEGMLRTVAEIPAVTDLLLVTAQLKDDEIRAFLENDQCPLLTSGALPPTFVTLLDAYLLTIEMEDTLREAVQRLLHLGKEIAGRVSFPVPQTLLTITENWLAITAFFTHPGMGRVSLENFGSSILQLPPEKTRGIRRRFVSLFGPQTGRSEEDLVRVVSKLGPILSRNTVAQEATPEVVLLGDIVGEFGRKYRPKEHIPAAFVPSIKAVFRTTDDLAPAEKREEIRRGLLNSLLQNARKQRIYKRISEEALSWPDEMGVAWQSYCDQLPPFTWLGRVRQAVKGKHVSKRVLGAIAVALVVLALLALFILFIVR